MQYSEIEFERRKQRVRTLLETHDDIYDSVSRNETAQASSGFAEPVAVTMLCSCGGMGCGQCERSAVRAAELGFKLRPGRCLVILRDPYDTGVEGAFDPQARSAREKAKLIDDTIERLRELELVRAGVYAAEVDNERLLVLAESRDRRGSYRELRMALDGMPRGLRGEAAVGWLAEHLPKVIRIPRWAFEVEAAKVADDVLLLWASGSQVSGIADLLGISKRQVRAALRAARQ